ncbi:MAG: FAD-dependent oxidoreductase [Pseudomonadota bacterium]
MNIVVVGAGIVGVSTAIWLLREGHEVTLIDRLEPGEGTSYGNAGVLASGSVVPVTTPGLIKKVPKMLLDPNQPLFLKWGYLPKLLPWLRRYLSHANVADTTRIAAGLTHVVGDSLAEHQALARETGAEGYVTPSDYNFAYTGRAQYDADAFGWGLRRDNGFDWNVLEAGAVKEYDPNLTDGIGLLARMPDHGHIKDPGAYVKALAAHAKSQGAQILQAEVSDVARDNGEVTGVRAGGETVPCDNVVLCTGVWSKGLSKALGVDVPLESERGYHIELYEPSIVPRAPTMVASGKFVVTPMEGRLRLAGLVELGGLDAPPSRQPFRLLENGARKLLPGITWKEKREWMGHRPAPADSLPLIGPVPAVKGAYLGFGHHHIGLTAGPKTGRLLAQMISGKRPNVDTSAFAPSRFAKGGQSAAAA